MAHNALTGTIACSCGNKEFHKVRQTIITTKKTTIIVNAKCTKCGREHFHAKFVHSVMRLIHGGSNHENTPESL